MATSECPAESCRDPQPRQRSLTDVQISIIRAVDDKSWPSDAMYCTYCRCVYSYGADGRKNVRGSFDHNDVWIPSRHA